jgi:hypothetical protein
MSEARLRVRVAVLVLAMFLHLVAGLVGLLADLVKADFDLIFEADPHPLDRWERPAVVGWMAIGVALPLLTFWSYPRRRFRVQLLLPVAALAVWLAIVLLAGPFPVTLRAEVAGAVMTTSARKLESGPQVLVIRNATDTYQIVDVLRSDRPLRASESVAGIRPDWEARVDWFPLDHPGCFFCNNDGLELEPREEARRTVVLMPGYYALVCARIQDGWLAVDDRCQPAFFSVEQS